MLGFYQIMIKNPTTGIEIKWDVLVMENLFYDRKTTRVNKISIRKEKPVYRPITNFLVVDF